MLGWQCRMVNTGTPAALQEMELIKQNQKFIARLGGTSGPKRSRTPFLAIGCMSLKFHICANAAERSPNLENFRISPCKICKFSVRTIFLRALPKRRIAKSHIVLRDDSRLGSATDRRWQNVASLRARRARRPGPGHSRIHWGCVNFLFTLTA